MHYILSLRSALSLVVIILQVKHISAKSDQDSNSIENNLLNKFKTPFVLIASLPAQSGRLMQHLSEYDSLNNQNRGEYEISYSEEPIAQTRKGDVSNEADHSISNRIHTLGPRDSRVQKNVAIKQNVQRTSWQVWSSSAFTFSNKVKQRSHQEKTTHKPLTRLQWLMKTSGNGGKLHITREAMYATYIKRFKPILRELSSRDGASDERSVLTQLKPQLDKAEVVGISHTLSSYPPLGQTSKNEVKYEVQKVKSTAIAEIEVPGILRNQHTGIPITRNMTTLNIINNDIIFSNANASKKAQRYDKTWAVSAKMTGDKDVGQQDKVEVKTGTRHSLKKRNYDSTSDNDVLTSLELFPRRTSHDSFSNKWLKLKQRLNEMYDNLTDTQSQYKEIEKRVKGLLKEGDQLAIEVEKQRNWSDTDNAIRAESLKQIEAARKLFERKIVEEDRNREKIEQELMISDPDKKMEVIQRELDNERLKMIGEQKMDDYLGLQIRYPLGEKGVMTKDKPKEGTMVDGEDDLYDFEKYGDALKKRRHFPGDTVDNDLDDVDKMLAGILSRKVRNAGRHIERLSSLEGLLGGKTKEVVSKMDTIHDERDSMDEEGFEFSDSDGRIEEKSVSHGNSETKNGRRDYTDRVDNHGGEKHGFMGESETNIDDEVLNGAKKDSLEFDANGMYIYDKELGEMKSAIQRIASEGWRTTELTEKQTGNDVDEKRHQEDERWMEKYKKIYDEFLSFSNLNKTDETFNKIQSDNMTVDQIIEALDRNRNSLQGSGENQDNDTVMGDFERQWEENNKYIVEVEKNVTKMMDLEDKYGQGVVDEQKEQIEGSNQREVSGDYSSKELYLDRNKTKDINDSIEETNRDLQMMESHNKKILSKYTEMQEQDYIAEQQGISDAMNKLSNDLENLSQLSQGGK